MNEILDKKTIKLFIITFVATALGVGVMFSLNSMVKIDASPSQGDFRGLYEAMASKSEEIVGLSNEVADKIRFINEMDQAGETEEAFSLIKEAEIKNELAKEKAIELSQQIEALIMLIPEMVDPADKTEALQTAGLHLSLIEEFIQYTESIEGFFEILKVALATDSVGDRIRVEQYLNDINRKQAKIVDIFNRF